MHFEVYVDSLLILHFVMNAYLLALVNKMLHQTMSRKRIMCGALAGAVLSLVPFVLPIKLLGCTCVSFVLSVLSMTLITFRTYRRENFFCILEKLTIGTMLLGGGMLVLLRLLPKTMKPIRKNIIILVTGGVLYMIFSRFIDRSKKRAYACSVTLFGKKCVKVDALLDTGNGLTEPISGKPVAILDKEVFENAFGKGEMLMFRAIPYHSVGKMHGILPGYLLDKIIVETEEGAKEYRKIYIGICDNISETGKYKMIMHPKILN